MSNFWRRVTWSALVIGAAAVGGAGCVAEDASGFAERIGSGDQAGAPGNPEVSAAGSSNVASPSSAAVFSEAGAANEAPGGNEAAGAVNEAGGAADEAAGAANAPPEPGCGNGVIDPGEACDPPFAQNNCGGDCQPISTEACNKCTQLELRREGFEDDLTNCSALTGVATAGSAAGVAKSYLCNETLACIRLSECAKAGSPPARCYYGEATTPQGLSAGLANGPCRAEFERGLETTDPDEVFKRIGHYNEYGAARAYARIDADQSVCGPECGLCPCQ